MMGRFIHDALPGRVVFGVGESRRALAAERYAPFAARVAGRFEHLPPSDPRPIDRDAVRGSLDAAIAGQRPAPPSWPA